MQIALKYFGATQDITLRNEEIIDTNASTMEELKLLLLQKYPELSRLQSLRYAINSEFINSDIGLSPHDEVALIPPVSGG